MERLSNWSGNYRLQIEQNLSAIEPDHQEEQRAYLQRELSNLYRMAVRANKLPSSLAFLNSLNEVYIYIACRAMELGVDNERFDEAYKEASKQLLERETEIINTFKLLDSKSPVYYENKMMLITARAGADERMPKDITPPKSETTTSTTKNPEKIITKAKCVCNYVPVHFRNEKTLALSKLSEGGDKSIKGLVDSAVVTIVKLLNEDENYYTTSSCSGRIIVLGSNLGSTHKTQKKKNLKWEEVHHNVLYNTDAFIDRVLAVNPSHHERITFKFEPFIMHIRCANVEASQRLLTVALAAGYRNSGVVISNTGRCTLAIRDTAMLEVPLAQDSTFWVDRAYMRRLCREADSRMKENLEKLKKFEKAIEIFLGKAPSSHEKLIDMVMAVNQLEEQRTKCSQNKEAPTTSKSIKSGKKK